MIRRRVDVAKNNASVGRTDDNMRNMANIGEQRRLRKKVFAFLLVPLVILAVSRSLHASSIKVINTNDGTLLPLPVSASSRSEVLKTIDSNTTNISCRKESVQHKVVLDHIEILPPATAKSFLDQRILCFIPIISTADNVKKASEIRHKTWGKHCDKLIFASNATDHELGLFKVEVTRDNYWHLWEKQRETMRHIWRTNGQDYDWFVKADLDTYIIMENLKSYLASDEIQSQIGQPLILGRRLARPEEKWHKGFDHNESLVEEFLRKSDNKFIYVDGGAGYVMNREYLKTFYQSMDEYFCLSGREERTFPEDVALGFCMGYQGYFPYNTRDEFKRERFHMFSPRAMYDLNVHDEAAWWVRFHDDVGGVKNGEDCCSTTSISFHRLKEPDALLNMQRQLYDCPKEIVVDKQEEDEHSRLLKSRMRRKQLALLNI